MINRLIHFSDLHIRLFKDHDVYRGILESALKEWKTLAPDRIVFTGDLVHSKNQMTPELVEFVAWVLTECASITKTIVIIGNHDFLERVCDRFYGLLGDGTLRDLPRGVDQYLEQRADAVNRQSGATVKSSSSSTAAEERQLKKDLARVEKQIAKGKERVASLLAEQEEESLNHVRLGEIDSELSAAAQELQSREEEWLEITLALES